MGSNLCLWPFLMSMAKLTPRYTRQELETLVELIYPEEHRHWFTDGPWTGEGFRHWLDPKVACIEHYWPIDKPILPGLHSGRCGDGSKGEK
jgi:hypothetical protein